MKKICKKLLLVGGFMLLPAISIWLCNSNSRVSLKEENALKEKTIAMFVQNGDGNYDESTSDEFPKEGYTLNTEKSSCKNGGTLSQNRITKKIKLKASNSDSCTLYFDKIQSPASAATLAALNATSNGIKTSGFENPATTDEGIFEMEDDYGISYYYRGAVENNYILFANSFWRIIRINGDGSLRILYDGPQAFANGTSDARRVALTNTAWNSNYNDAKYAGYMYGGANGEASTDKAQAQTNQTDSNIKKELDSWYNHNIKTFCGGAVTDTIFCNDRSTPNSSYALGYGSNETWYGAYSRFLTNQEKSQPTFKCEQKNDAFTVNDTQVGNGALTYPVGLITTDEIVAAGSGKYGTANTNYYLYKTSSYWYWSFSPYYMNSTGGAAVFIVDASGFLGSGYVYGDGAVAPVINISIEGAKMTGDGTMDNPYIPKYKLTIHLVYSDTGEKIADDIVNYYPAGEMYYVPVPGIDGYFSDQGGMLMAPKYAQDEELTVSYYSDAPPAGPDPAIPVEPAEPAP